MILTKTANALISDSAPAFTPRALSTGFVLDRIRRHYGGLWVGGRVSLFADRVTFTPNALNRSVNTGSLDVAIPLADVVRVEVLPGFLTRIVAIHTAGRVLKVRCFGARGLAAAIDKARWA